VRRWDRIALDFGLCGLNVVDNWLSRNAPLLDSLSLSRIMGQKKQSRFEFKGDQNSPHPSTSRRHNDLFIVASVVARVILLD
jgi:hypothetical protein